jgi:SOS-response transcriptional repressor LexA
MTRRSPVRKRPFAKSSGKASGSSEDVRDGILAFIAGYISERGYPPSMREIGRELGRSPQSIMVHLDRLEADGLLTREPGIPRSLRLVLR